MQREISGPFIPKWRSQRCVTTPGRVAVCCAAMGKKSKPAPTSTEAQPFNTPFAALSDLRHTVAPAPSSPPNDATPAEANAADAPPSNEGLRGKLVIRHERKGHGGKTVTLLAGVQRPAQALQELARDLAKELGTSCRVRDGLLVIGGDQRERLSQWLKARGATNLVLGS